MSQIHRTTWGCHEQRHAGCCSVTRAIVQYDGKGCIRVSGASVASHSGRDTRFAMSTPDRSGNSQEGSAETGASGTQLVRLEDLQDLVQTLVRRAIADGEAGQPSTASDSGERLVGGLRAAESGQTALRTSLRGSRPLR